MDLGIDDLVGPGRRAQEDGAAVRSLSPEDAQRLAAPRPAERQTLSKLRHKHHTLARALANGLSEHEAGIVSGFMPATISVLKSDPAFAELVRFYAGEASKAFNAMQEKLFGVSMAALEELEDRLDSEADKFSRGELNELVKMGADRTGNGPQTTQNVNVNIGLADRMAAAQKRLEAARDNQSAPDMVTYSEVK